jgi:hypothetical protein
MKRAFPYPVAVAPAVAIATDKLYKPFFLN